LRGQPRDAVETFLGRAAQELELPQCLESAVFVRRRRRLPARACAQDGSLQLGAQILPAARSDHLFGDRRFSGVKTSCAGTRTKRGLAASHASRRHKAVFTLCSTDDRYTDDIHYKGGCLLNEKLGWSDTMFAYSSRPPDPVLVLTAGATCGWSAWKPNPCRRSPGWSTGTAKPPGNTAR